MRFPDVGASLALQRTRDIRVAPAMVCALLKVNGLPFPVSLVAQGGITRAGQSFRNTP